MSRRISVPKPFSPTTQLKGAEVPPIKYFDAHPYFFDSSKIVAKNIDDNDWKYPEDDEPVDTLEVLFLDFYPQYRDLSSNRS